MILWEAFKGLLKMVIIGITCPILGGVVILCLLAEINNNKDYVHKLLRWYDKTIIDAIL